MLSRVKAVLAWQRGANRSEFRPMAHAHLDVMYIHVQYIRCPRYYRFSDHKRVHQPHSDRTTRCNLQCASGLIVSARRNLTTAAVPSVSCLDFFSKFVPACPARFSRTAHHRRALPCVFLSPFLSCFCWQDLGRCRRTYCGGYVRPRHVQARSPSLKREKKKQQSTSD